MRARAEAAPRERVVEVLAGRSTGEQAIDERRKKARVAHTSTIFSTPDRVWTYVRGMLSKEHDPKRLFSKHHRWANGRTNDDKPLPIAKPELI